MKVLVALCFLAWVTPVVALDVGQSVKPLQPLSSEPVVWKLWADGDAASLELSVPTLPEGLQVLRKSAPVEMQAAGNKRIEQEYILLSHKPSIYWIDGLEAKDASGSETAPAIVLKVLSSSSARVSLKLSGSELPRVPVNEHKSVDWSLALGFLVLGSVLGLAVYRKVSGTRLSEGPQECLRQALEQATDESDFEDLLQALLLFMKANRLPLARLESLSCMGLESVELVQLQESIERYRYANGACPYPKLYDVVQKLTRKDES